MSYCLTKSLKMVLDHRGDSYPLPFLECVSTEPFGFVYVREDRGGFAVNGYPHDRAGERLLQLLGYDYQLSWFDASGPALSQLRASLEHGPVVVGMLDMGFLVYQPDHRRKRGSDHAVVVLELRDDVIVVHDPDGYVSVPLPLKDFLAAWKAEGIYTGKSSMLWIIGGRVRQPPIEEIYRRALELGLSNIRPPSEARGKEVQVLLGPKALQTLSEDIRARRVGRWIRLYTSFTFRVSGQRCYDSALFIREAPFQNEHLEHAAQLRLEQAARYGEAQAAAVARKPGRAAQALERIAVLEEAVAGALEQGLSVVEETPRGLKVESS